MRGHNNRLEKDIGKCSKRRAWGLLLRDRCSFSRIERSVTSALTLPQLCQNYMAPCVRIGKMKVTAPVLNA
jgi:hypothetical protein